MGLLAYAVGGVGGFLIGGPIGAAVGLGVVKLASKPAGPVTLTAPGGGPRQSPPHPKEDGSIFLPSGDIDFVGPVGPGRPPGGEIP